MYRMYVRKAVIKRNTVLALRDLVFFFLVQTPTRAQLYEGRHCADFPLVYHSVHIRLALKKYFLNKWINEQWQPIISFILSHKIPGPSVREIQ